MHDEVKVSREKTFDEMSDAERIQILRRELRASNALLKAMHAEFQKLANHTHTADGNIAIRYYSSGSESGPIGYRYDPLA